MKSPKLRSRWTLAGIAVFITLTALGAYFFARYLFRIKPTQFRATIDATSIEFTPSLPSSGESGGLLSSPSTVNLLVHGCDSVRYLAAPADKPTPCLNGDADFHNVRLSSVTFGQGTSARIWVEDGALNIRLYRSAGHPGFNVGMMADADSTSPLLAHEDDRDQERPPRHLKERAKPEKSEPSMPPGEWRASSTANAMQLTLRETVAGSLSYPEIDLALMDGKSVLFETEADHASSLVNSTSRFLFPEIPEPASTLALGDGWVSLGNLQTSTIRELALNRSPKNRIVSLHINITGQSEDLQWQNPYTVSKQNQALRPYDILLHARHQPKLLGIAAVLASLVSGLYTLFLTINAAIDLVHKAKHSRKEPEKENGYSS